MPVMVHFKCCWSAAAAASVALFLNACGSGGSEENSPAPIPPPTIQLEGGVGDGPVIGASMRISGKNGALIAESESDASGRYRVTMQAGSDAYPLTIEASDGVNLVTGLPPDFRLRAVLPSRRDNSVVNVNAYSTLALEVAKELSGGITSSNVDAAESIVVSSLNNGLSTLASSGPLFTRIDESNIAELMRAAGSLAETIRRTSSTLEGSGLGADPDVVIAALGSDLVDQVIDGRGGSRSDARIAAIASLVNAQVVLEAMRNELRVNGVNATAAMTAAIQQTNPGAVLIGLEDLAVTSGMLQQATVALAAAETLVSDSAIRQLRAALATVQPGVHPDRVRAAIPDSYRQTLDSFINIAAGASDANIAMVNEVVRARGVTPDVNNAPTISGTPSPSVAAGSNYQFAPTAGDLDGDTLSFSIVGKPGWLSFSNATGALSGTPSSGHAGTYADILISVSDGQTSTGLAPFSITVTVPDVNSAPTIGGTPSPSVAAGSNYHFAPTAGDIDGDTLSFSIVGKPGWLSFSNATGVLSGTPSSSQARTYDNIRISVSDGQTSTGLAPFSITVTVPDVNSAPTISGTPNPTAAVGVQYSFHPTVHDADGDALLFNISGKPGWLNFNTTTGRIQGTPSSTNVGIHDRIVISVTDGEATVSLPSFSITVLAGNSPPTIGGTPPGVATVDAVYSFTPNVHDSDGDTLTFVASGLPSWLKLNSSTGRINGTPRAGDVGNHTGIRITVSDGTATATLGPFSIAVQAISLGSVTLSWTPPTRNTDGSSLTDLAGYRIYWGPSIGNYPNSITLNNAGLSSYVVENLAPGTYVFVATSRNAAGVESAFSNPATRTVQ